MDQFLSEVDHDQFERWREYFAIEPQGWQAFQHLIRRMTFITAQVSTSKKLDERKFELSLIPVDPVAKFREQRARMEAAAIRDEVREAIEVSVQHG